MVNSAAENIKAGRCTQRRINKSKRVDDRWALQYIGARFRKVEQNMSTYSRVAVRNIKRRQT